MTKLQRKQHKIGNQQRKQEIISCSKKVGQDNLYHSYWAHASVCQNGKYTNLVRSS